MGWIFWLLFLIPLTLFIIIVLPILLWTSFRRQQQSGHTLNENETRRIDELMRQSQQMRERIHILESILDEEYPNWRGRQ